MGWFREDDDDDDDEISPIDDSKKLINDQASRYVLFFKFLHRTSRLWLT